MDLAHKAIASGVEVKDAEKGIVEAIVGRTNVKDHDGDMFLTGSFGSRSVRLSAYNHRSWPHRGGLPPVGRGTIRERGDEVVASLRFFMNTESGREHFEQVKEMDDLQEWSFGWIPGTEKTESLTEEQRAAGIRKVIKEVPVVEVSPVLMGASIGTRTTSVKCEACQLAEEKAAKEEESAETEAAEPEEPENEEPEGGEEEAEAKDTGGNDFRQDIIAEVGRYEALKAANR